MVTIHPPKESLLGIPSCFTVKNKLSVKQGRHKYLLAEVHSMIVQSTPG